MSIMKIKALQKKLRQIDEIAQRKKENDQTLEPAQLQKLKMRKQLQAELVALETGQKLVAVPQMVEEPEQEVADTQLSRDQEAAKVQWYTCMRNFPPIDWLVDLRLAACKGGEKGG
jgi:hypothetical protein